LFPPCTIYAQFLNPEAEITNRVADSFSNEEETLHGEGESNKTGYMKVKPSRWF
jgi:hypothetical protein